MPFLTTERLSFRTWNEGDLPRALQLWGDPEVTRFIYKEPLDQEQTKARLDREILCRQKSGTQYWPLFEKQTGEFVGCCGLKPWTHSPAKGTELGFHLVREKWGKGYAKEAGRGVVDYAFAALRLKELLAGHHPGNVASKKILLELGFEYLEEVFYEPTQLMHPFYRLEARV